jgi:hypothetical protein
MWPDSPGVSGRQLYSVGALALGGVAIMSTQFHGYVKNLLLALTGKIDQHFGPLWDHGHFKFSSVPTLTERLTEVGFRDIQFSFAGRIPALPKSNDRHCPQAVLNKCMKIDQVTPLILTYNEAANLERTLSSLGWASRIIIVDSFSTDETLAIAGKFSNVDVIQREFDHFAEQCNFGLSHVNTDWTLSLDADYVIPKQAAEELLRLSNGDHAAYRAGFRYCVFGRPLRATLYPPRVVLYRTELAQYHRDGHAHRVEVQGAMGELATTIDHDDHKLLQRWLASQLSYAKMEAEKLATVGSVNLSWKDHVRRWYVFAPPLTMIYCLFVKGLILDGWPGVYYTFQRVYAEILLSLVRLDRRLRTTESVSKE